MNHRLYLSPAFAEAWDGKDVFAEAFALEGEVFRKVKSRRTFRFELGGRGYFAKIHHGVGWREIFKNLLQFKLPVLGADNEYLALRRLAAIGVDSMTPAAYAARGANPARFESFLITEELTDTVSLEDYCRDWTANPPSFTEKNALLSKVARMTSLMHRAGINHRDCYICHFLLKRDSIGSGEYKLHIIDLHRAQLRHRVPYRYRVKDVAGLYFSAMDLGLTRRDVLRFIREYADAPLKKALRCDRPFWRAVDRTAQRLFRKVHHQEPPRIGM